MRIYDIKTHMVKFNEAKTINRRKIQGKDKKDARGIYLTWYDYIIPVIIFSLLYGG